MSDSIKTKIKKLLEMTEQNGCTEAEAAVALEKAQRLLAEHNLSMDEVSEVKEPTDFIEKGDFLAFAWAKKVAESIARLYDCEYVCEGNRRSSKQNHFRARFVGRQSNAETARLITQFVIKTILKVSRQAQKEHNAPNRFATDFAHGCADRVNARAWDLWREANKDAIEAEQKKRAERYARRVAMQLDPKALPPGTYLTQLCDGDNYIKKEFTLDNHHTMQLFNQTMEKPPRGIYSIWLKCLEGKMASEFEYFWECREDNRACHSGSGRSLVQDQGVYELGSKAGNNIGLHIQVNSDPAAQVK